MSTRSWVSLVALCALFTFYLCLLASRDQTELLEPPMAATTVPRKTGARLKANRKLLMAKQNPGQQHTAPNKPGKASAQPGGKSPQLKESRQVVFAKVHKAASSTVQNIMLRFAIARQLDVLLPSVSRGSGLSERYSVVPPQKIIKFPKSRRFDILCSHVIYNESEIAKYFPAKAVRVAILREPLKQAVSALTYYTNSYPTGSLIAGFKKHRDDPINAFLRYPQHFCPVKMPPAASHLNNRMSIDLGFDPENFEASKKNKTKIQAFLRKVEKQFQIVLVSDYFDESMVLLRRLLHWPMKDIIYLKVNVAKEKKNPVWRIKPKLNETVRKRFREWAEIDYELYEHFLPIFLRRMKLERKFQEEVDAYRNILKRVSDFCTNSTFQEVRVPKSSWTNEFTVSKDECTLMSMGEKRLTRMAQILQIRRYKKDQKS